MTLIPPSARLTAETTLTADGTVTRPGDDTYDAEAGTITAGTPATVWSGKCSISPPTSSDRTDTLGDDRIIGALICRLPTGPGTPATVAGDPAAITVGDLVAIDTATYHVRLDLTRTTMALRRLVVVEVTDAQAVPK